VDYWVAELGRASAETVEVLRSLVAIRVEALRELQRLVRE